MKVEHFENAQPVFLIGKGILRKNKREIDHLFHTFRHSRLKVLFNSQWQSWSLHQTS